MHKRIFALTLMALTLMLLLASGTLRAQNNPL